MVGAILAPLFFIGGAGLLFVTLINRKFTPEKRREYLKLGAIMMLIGVLLLVVEIFMFGALPFFFQ